MAGYEGKQHQWDFELNNFGFTTYRPRGVPAWRVAREPDIAGQAKGSQAVPRVYRSTHMGFGWGQMLADNTYHYGNPADGRYPMGAFCGPLVYSLTLQGTGRGAVTGFVEKGGIVYAVAGKFVNKITLNATPSSDAVASTGTWPYDLTTGNASAVGTVGTEFDGNVVFGVTAASGADAVIFNGTSFTVMSGADVPSSIYLVKYWGDTDYQIATCFNLSGVPSVAWAAQGATLTTGANWAGYDGDYGVGDTSGSFTGLAAVERTLFPAMNDGLYYIDGRSGRAPRLIAAVPRDANNGVNTFADSTGKVWYPTKAGLLLYDPATGAVDDISPGRALPNRSGIIGRETAFAQFRAWTYTAVYDGTNSYIMAGRAREEGEPGYGPYIWHGALAKIASDTVTSMHISATVSPPRLLMGLNSGDVKSIILPSNGDNPLSDTSCFLEETAVRSMSGIRGASRRWYEGEVVEITTASGHKLTGTPNHPILTSTGWKALGILAEGDNVICCGGVEEVRLANHEPNNMEAPIGQVFRLLEVSGASVKVAGIKQQFHGDGQESNIDIVLTDSLLLNRDQSSVSQPVGQDSLATTDLTQQRLFSQSATVQRLIGAFLTTHGSVHVLSPLLALFRRGSVKAELARLTTIANRNAFPDKDSSHGTDGHTATVSNGLHRLTSVIPADQLGKIVREWYAAVGVGLTGATNMNTSSDKSRLQELRSKSHGTSDALQGLPIVNIPANKLLNIIGDALSHDGKRLTAATNGNAGLDKAAAQNQTTNTDGPSDSKQRLSTIQIAADRVVKIDRRHFAGHVYNLQTDSNWYIANNIIAHNCTFAAAASLYFGADDFGGGGMRWNLETVVCETEMNHDDSTVIVYERRDLGSWVQIGSTITASGRTVITPASDKRFNRLELRFDLVNGTSASTPVVRVLAGQALPRPSLRNVIYTTVVLDDEALSEMGVSPRKAAQDLITELETYDSAATYTLKHHWSGSEVSETVEVISFDRRIAYSEDMKASVYLGDLILKKLA